MAIVLLSHVCGMWLQTGNSSVFKMTHEPSQLRNMLFTCLYNRQCNSLWLLSRNRDGSVGTVTCYVLEYRDCRAEIFPCSVLTDSWGPPSLSYGYRVLLHRCSFPGGVNRKGRKHDDSSPSNDDARNGGDIHPLPHTCSCRGSKLINHSDFYLLHLP
jgi:hypothetical protein